MNESKIAALVQETLESEQFPDCFLVDYKLHANHKLEVFVDSDQGLSLGRCQQISRAIEARLDTEKWLGEKYVLEVSSPG
ncbi:MAG: ribosome maturation factor, partial [Bacteroidota bacterium]